MATKIKDGLFIGDAEASQDPEFIELNKITFVINCAGRQLPNLWEQCGLHYLTYPWGSDPDCMLFDGGNVVITQIANFIDGALEKGDSVLVHSLDGKGRCVVCLTAYLMFKYRWGFEKALDFVCSKRPDAAPNPGFLQQLYQLDERLCAQWYGPGRAPPERERIRHDQWIPLHPSDSNRSEQGNQNSSQQEEHGIFAVSGGPGKDVTSPAPYSSSRSAPTPPRAYTKLSAQVQGEELVLVHSFLNSRPRFNAIPQNPGACGDLEATELHWIDRPRIDKLIAAGFLRPNKSRSFLAPVSPITGLSVPERPRNSSYNSLSPSCSEVGKAAAPTLVGILKTIETVVNRRDGHQKGPSVPKERVACPKFRAVRSPGGGSSLAVASPVESRMRTGGGRTLTGGDPLHQRVERADPADEIVVEDLSDAKTDLWERLQERPREGQSPWDNTRREGQGIGRDGEGGVGESWQGRDVGKTPNVPLVQGQRSIDAVDTNKTQPPRGSGMPQKIDTGDDEQVRGISPKRTEERQTGDATGQTSIRGPTVGVRNTQFHPGVPVCQRGESQKWSGATVGQNIPEGTEAKEGHIKRILESIYGSHDQEQRDDGSQKEADYLPQFTQRVASGGDTTLRDRREGATLARSPGEGSGPSRKARERSSTFEGSRGRGSKAVDGGLDRGEIHMARDKFLEGKPRRDPKHAGGKSESCGSGVARTSSPSASRIELPEEQAEQPGHSGSRPMGPGWRQEARSSADICPRDTMSEAIRSPESSSGAPVVDETGEPEEQDASSITGKGLGLQQLPRAPNSKQGRPASPRYDRDHGQAYLVRGRASLGPSPQPQKEDRRRWGGGAGNASRDDPLRRTTVTRGTDAVEDCVAGVGSNHLAGSTTPFPVGEELRASKESPRICRSAPRGVVDVEVQAAGRRSAQGGRDIGGESLPRDMWKRATGSSSVHPHHLRAPGTGDQIPTTGERFAHSTRCLGKGKDGKPPQQVQCGHSRPMGPPLPFACRRTKRFGGDDVFRPNQERDRWANPAPRVRRRPSAAPGFGPSDPREIFADEASGDRVQGGGMVAAGIRGGIKRPKDSCSPSLAHHPPAPRDGSRSRSRVAPTFRAGSPAPTNTRGKEFAVGNSGSPSAPHFLNKQKVHRSEEQPQFSKSQRPLSDPIASSARASIGWGEGSTGRERKKSGLSRQAPPPSPTARDHQRRQRDDAPSGGYAPRSSSAGRGGRAPASGQRPSTSEGLLNSGIGARRGRAPRMASRPVSASGLHHPISASPASEAGSPYVQTSRRVSAVSAVSASPGINKPRWK